MCISLAIILILTTHALADAQTPDGNDAVPAEHVGQSEAPQEEYTFENDIVPVRPGRYIGLVLMIAILAYEARHVYKRRKR